MLSLQQEPIRVYGWKSPDISQNSTGARVCGKYGDGSLKKSLSTLSLALSEYSDTDSSILSSEDFSHENEKKSYKEALESVDERSPWATSDPVAIPWELYRFRRRKKRS